MLSDSSSQRSQNDWLQQSMTESTSSGASIMEHLPAHIESHDVRQIAACYDAVRRLRDRVMNDVEDFWRTRSIRHLPKWLTSVENWPFLTTLHAPSRNNIYMQYLSFPRQGLSEVLFDILNDMSCILWGKKWECPMQTSTPMRLQCL